MDDIERLDKLHEQKKNKTSTARGEPESRTPRAIADLMGGTHYDIGTG
jgi:hypothetical protein